MFSYAQNFEDVILQRVFKDRPQGFYIDVGACDPVIESVTKWFYEKGWSGINIEPNEWFYARLLADRPRDINLNLAVGERDECRSFHVFEKIGNSTFEESSRDRYVEMGYPSTEKTVHVTTLAAICRDYVRSEIDFLKVDCEGWEKFALAGADWDRFRPIIVIVEATEPGTPVPSWADWDPILTHDGKYEMVYFDGLNRFYLRREYADLRSHFGVPPNVFDEFKLYNTEQAERDSRALYVERDRLAARVAEFEQTINHAVESDRLRDAEMLGIKTSLELADQANQALHHESQSLANRACDLERQLAVCQGRLSELERERDHLETYLRQSRLWIGQLSQNLAAAGRG